MEKSVNGTKEVQGQSNLSKEDVERVIDAGKLLFSVLTDDELERLEKEIQKLNTSLSHGNGNSKIGNNGVA